MFFIYNLGGLGYLIPPPPNRAHATTQEVDCPNDFAIKLRQGEHFPGRYLACEDYDQFWLHISRHELRAARELTFPGAVLHHTDHANKTNPATYKE